MWQKQDVEADRKQNHADIQSAFKNYLLLENEAEKNLSLHKTT